MRPPSDTAARTGPLWVWPVLALALLLAACAGGGDEQTGPSAEELVGRHFAAAEITGHDLARPQLVTVTFPADDGREGTWIESTGGCNASTSEFSIEAGRLRRTGNRMTTAAGCDQARHEQDDWLDEWLDRDPQVTLDGDRLTLTHDGVRLELREQPEEFRGSDAPLGGVTIRGVAGER